jgi:hypothetical protein
LEASTDPALKYLGNGQRIRWRSEWVIKGIRATLNPQTLAAVDGVGHRLRTAKMILTTPPSRIRVASAISPARIRSRPPAHQVGESGLQLPMDARGELLEDDEVDEVMTP